MFTLMRNLYRFSKKRKEKNAAIVLLGLDNAGKSTLFLNLKNENTEHTAPTWGFASHKLAMGNITTDVFDLGGGEKIRDYWTDYFAEAFGFVYVIDAADKSRFEEAKQALEKASQNSWFVGKPVLIMANKQDLPESVDAPTLALELELDKVLKQHPYHISPCTAMNKAGTGPDRVISEAMKWLQNAINNNFNGLKGRVENDMAEKKAKDEREKAEKRARVEKMREERRKKQEEEERLAAEASKKEEKQRLQPVAPQAEDNQVRKQAELSDHIMTSPRKEGSPGAKDMPLPNSLGSPATKDKPFPSGGRPTSPSDITTVESKA